MYCTKCGKKLQDGDRFCANCGAEVRKPKEMVSDDIVFNPPFKLEAQRRTEEILKSTEAQEQQKPKQETVDFAWNLDGFPSTQPRKTEEVDFNWGSVVEKRNNARSFSAGVADYSGDSDDYSPWAELHIPSPVKSERTETAEPQQAQRRKSEGSLENSDGYESLNNSESLGTIPELEELKKQTEGSENSESMSMSIEDLEKELFGLERAREEEEEKLAEPTIIAKSVDRKKPEADSTPASADVFVSLCGEPDISASGAGDVKAAETSDKSASDELNKVQKQEINTKYEEQSFKGDERFYTYNQKFEAFQKLLEQERQKIKSLENEFSDEPDETGEAKEMAEAAEKTETVSPAEKIETVSSDEVSSDEASEDVQMHDSEKCVDEIYVAFAPVTMTVDMTISPSEIAAKAEEAEVSTQDGTAEQKEVSASQAPPSNENTKSSEDGSAAKTCSADNGGTDSADAVKAIKKIDLFDDIEEDEEPKKFMAAKIIIGILAVLIAAELVILGVKFVAPDNSFSKAADKMMVKAADFIMNITGEDSTGEDDEIGDGELSGVDEETAQTAKLVKEASADVKTIGEVSYDPELKFSLLKNYSFDEIDGAEQFVDAKWYEGENGPVTYGQVLYETLVKHYDSWKSANDDESLVGINKLEIGESKTGEKGFYTLCRISFAGADGKDVVKYQTVFQKISEKTMIINETKEDNL